jgi:hypothetical protein
MAQITSLAKVLNGLVRNYDFTADELVFDSVRYGGLAGTLLTKTILDSLIANSHASGSDNQNIVAGDALTGGGSGATVTLNVNVDNSTIEVNADALRLKDGGVTEAKLDSGVDAQTFESTYTPTNYTPVAVGAEATTKISAHLKGIDNTLGAVDAANKTLSNLTSPTAINQDLIFDKASAKLKTDNETGATASESLAISTGTVATGNSGALTLETGNSSGAGGNTGALVIGSGDATNVGGSANSGSVEVKSGASNGADSGFVDLASGDSNTGTTGPVSVYSGGSSSTTENTGDIYIGSGYLSNASAAGTTGGLLVESGSGIADANSGNLDIRSGGVVDGVSGELLIKSGNASGTGNSGNVSIESGVASGGTRGNVKLDGSEIDVSSKKVTNLASGTVSTDAVNKGQLDAKVSKSGDSMTGNLAMGGNKVTGLGAPSANGDALRYDQLGANNGIATLDGSGKVPVSQLPSAIMTYEGVWNASTNSPTLVDGTGDTGMVYRVGTAGSQNLGSGSISFDVGDYVIYNGSIWEKSDTTDSVVSVNSQTGVVVLNTSHISENTNLYFTDERAQDAIGAMVANSSKVSLTYVDGTPSLTADIVAGSLVNADISASAAIAYSKLNLASSIVNADVSASAAIAYSKLNLSGSIVDADVSASAAIAYSKLSLTNSIVNADISASAAIAYSKLNLSNSIVAGDLTSASVTLAKLASDSVDENKIVSTAHDSSLSGGSGAKLSVVSAPAMKKSMVAGEALAADTSFLVRFAVSGETAGRVYKATAANAVADGKFWAIGIAIGTGQAAGDAVDVIPLGSHTLGSSDAAFGAGDIGKAVWLTTAGAFSVTSPSSSGDASFRVGSVETTTKVFIDGKQLTGIN